MQRHCAQAKGPEKDGQALGLVDSPGKDDSCLTRELVGEEPDQICVFVLEWDEDVVLYQGFDGLIFTIFNTDSDWLSQRSPL